MRGNEEVVDPTLIDDLILPEPDSTGEGEHPSQSGTAMAAVRFAMELKEMRQSRGLTIKDVARKANLDLATLSRLENGRIFNPKLDTLGRYALALGFEVVLSLEPIDPAYLD